MIFQKLFDRLNASQIVKILTLYTAGDEEDISHSFIKNLQQYMTENKPEDPKNTSLLHKTTYRFALTIAFKPCNVKLQDVTLPPALLKEGLGEILKRI